MITRIDKGGGVPIYHADNYSDVVAYMKAEEAKERRRAYRQRDRERTAAVRAAAALAPRLVTVAEAGAVVRPATDAERATWVSVEFAGQALPAVSVR